MMDVQIWQWAAFAAFVVAMLLVDLAFFEHRGEAVPLRRAVGWSVGWTGLGLAFAGLLWVWQGREQAEAYLAGFLIEKSLSIDNVFVFALVFAYFGVPAVWQRRALFWGIVGAIVLRAMFIAAGAALLDTFHFTTYVFGVFLVATGVRIGREAEVHVDPERNPVLVLLRRLLPFTARYHEDRLLAREHGHLRATPMLAALVLIATLDLVFAVDSIPAIFAVTRETFIVYAANAFSLLGLASLYFVLAGVMMRFRFLNVGLAVVLVFVGAKMTLTDVVHVPVYVSLLVIVLTLSAAIAASILWPTSQRSGGGTDDGAGSVPGSTDDAPQTAGSSSRLGMHGATDGGGAGRSP